MRKVGTVAQTRMMIDASLDFDDNAHLDDSGKINKSVPKDYRMIACCRVVEMIPEKHSLCNKSSEPPI